MRVGPPEREAWQTPAGAQIRSEIGERKGAPSPCRRPPAKSLNGGQVDIDPVQARKGYELPSTGAYTGVILLVELGAVVEHILDGLPEGIVRVGDVGKLNIESAIYGGY